MSDIEKVIKAMEYHKSGKCKIDGILCPYWKYKNCDGQLESDALELLKEQERIIKQYQKADSFLFAHGWKWENYIDTREKEHSIEVGEDGLPY